MHIKSLFALMSLLLLFSQSHAVFAISVFQWVDAEGVTHFSEETPSNNLPTKQLSHYELAENYPQGQAPEEDYFSIVNQWKRTNDERESRMKLKQANKQTTHFEPQQAQPRATYQPTQRYYTGLLPSPYLYNRGRAHHRGHFVHQPKTREPGPTVTPGYAGNVAPQ
jgi:hypothetical protein